MDVFIGIVEFIEEPGALYTLNVIKYRGAFWLIADWKPAPNEGYTMPARAMSLENIPYQHTPDATICQFLLQSPISRSALQGHGSSAGYVVEDSPPVFLPVPKSVQ